MGKLAEISMVVKKNLDSNQEECKDAIIYLGQMFWAKVGTHPWWPCMVFYDPEGEEFHMKPSRIHVQFFGPLEERAWISLSNCIIFEGRKALDDYLSLKLTQARSKDKWRYQLKIPNHFKDAWEASCKEAEIAMKLDPDCRVKTFGRLSRDIKRRMISDEFKEEMITMMDMVPLSSKEDALAFQNFLDYKMESVDMDDDFDIKVFEKEIAHHWSQFEDHVKRKYLSNPLFMFGSLKSKKSERTPRVSTRQPAKNYAEQSEPASIKPRKSVSSFLLFLISLGCSRCKATCEQEE
ncbi:Histone-lysine N-methyltransferase NSD3 [Cichlidogyrus casuarinus]|uniref:Histone-lysine N-methyltransferase NSD3 n=1 Tax=Cichlidogyrus casuarinus TaxID=1844966 RepID=A0ABD2QCK7_9PLAT